jgi:hypothetical protein
MSKTITPTLLAPALCGPRVAACLIVEGAARNENLRPGCEPEGRTTPEQEMITR